MFKIDCSLCIDAQSGEAVVNSRFIAFVFLQHLKVIANEGELNTGDVDVQDWKSLRKLQVR